MPIAKIGQTRLGQNKNKDPLLPIIFCHCCIRTHGVSIVLYRLGLATIVYVDGDLVLGAWATYLVWHPGLPLVQACLQTYFSMHLWV